MAGSITPHTRIANHHFHVIAGFTFNCPCNLLCNILVRRVSMESLSALRHGVSGIDGQIQDHLFQLPCIGLDYPRAGIELCRDGNIFANQTMEKVFDARHHFVQIEVGGLHGLFAAEGEELAGERGRAATRFLDLLDMSSKLGVASQGL